MKTVLTFSPDIAAEIIRNGGIVAFPTETVYGLGADIFNEAAIANIFTAKGRPSDNPLIAHISKLSDFEKLAAEITDSARILRDAFFPGALTLVVVKKNEVPSIATAGLKTIGIRMPANQATEKFLSHCKTPLVAPSANISGRPSPTNWEAVYEDLEGKIDCILKGEISEYGLESTVVDTTIDPPVILRQGAVTIEMLRAEIPEIVVYEESKVLQPRSPGMKHKHYSPRAKVEILNSSIPMDEDLEDVAYIGFDSPTFQTAKTAIVRTEKEYAHSLFEFFRECDRQDIAKIYCQPVKEEGLGAALMDRIRRAAENNE